MVKPDDVNSEYQIDSCSKWTFWVKKYIIDIPLEKQQIHCIVYFFKINQIYKYYIESC